MNRKEASFILANIDRRVCDDELNEALDVAIKALDQEPCGDAIDRSKAIMISSGYCHPANVAKELAKLPSVNPQPCDDAISRQAAIDAITANNIWENEYNLTSSRIKKAVDHLPSVTPQPKTGHWEWVQYDYNPKLGNWHCSECRCIVVECVDKEEKGGIPLYKYCPQCGAKMQEAEIEG